MRFGFVVDNRRCIGCHACSTACKSENEVPLGVSRTWVKYTEVGAYPNVTRNFQVTRCNHCENPPCVAICPVSAMYQRPDKIVEFDKDICIGCKACIQACPYDAIHLDPDNGTAAKCHFCSHRTDIGLEPACVVVCPEHAILAGDLDDPNSEVAKAVANEAVTVRKPEQGTKPKLFYIEGNTFAQNPVASPAGAQNFMFTDPLDKDPTRMKGGRQAAQMVQVGYNAQHKHYWHWQVPAYIVTKDIAAGAMMLWPLFDTGREQVFPRLVLSGIALLFTVLTTLLLVFDLERPERFLSIVFRPQLRSWLARGAFVLITFSLVVTALFGLDLLAYLGRPLAEESIVYVLGLVNVPIAALTAVYTAFLFGQAEGRDLWQHPLLPLQLLIRSLTMGGAVVLAACVVAGVDAHDGLETIGAAFLIYGSLVDLVVTLVGDVVMRHATETAAAGARHMTKLSGRYGKLFWGGYVGAGRLLPFLLLGLAPAAVSGAAMWAAFGALSLLGLFCVEYAFVMAAQEVPNS